MYKSCEPQLHYLLPNNVFEDYLCAIFDLSMGIQQTLIANSCGKLLWCVQGHIKRVSLGSWETFIEVKNTKPIKKA
jgi:hypothetical protein